MEKILVIGATGTTGNKVVDELHKSETYEPIAMVRKPEQQTQFTEKGIQTIVADLTQEVTHTTKDVDKVIFAAGSKGKALDEVDRKGAIKMIDAAKKHHVQKFVMLSSIGADAPEEADQLQPYLRAKRDADEYLGNSGLDFTIVRPGTLNNEIPTGKIQLAKNLESRKGEISRGDVAKVLVKSLENTLANREVFEILQGEESIHEAIEKIPSVKTYQS